MDKVGKGPVAMGARLCDWLAKVASTNIEPPEYFCRLYDGEVHQGTVRIEFVLFEVSYRTF